MTPETARAWQRVLRDFVLILLGAFCLVFGVIWIKDPARLTIVIGASLALFGLPPALRFDSRRADADK